MSERDERPTAALVIVADGVGGIGLCGLALRRVLRTEKWPYQVEIFPWGHGFLRWHADLTNAPNRDTQARLMAERVKRYQEEHPLVPTFLVAKSGGSGVVVKALELLDDQQVERAVLLAPALSPAYDLSNALRAVRREMVVFWSPWDVFLLGIGTRVFGTVDRVRTASAGMVAFHMPAGPDENKGRQYDKLRQIRWRPQMAATGYLGGHFGPDSPFFLRRYVVPLLRFEETTEC
jgi:hypothetical protein